MPNKNQKGLGSSGVASNRRHPLYSLKSLLLRKKLRRSFKLTEDHLLSVLLVRGARYTVLGERLFSDPAWDILLELYAAKLGQRSISLSDLSRATGTPPSTTVRWVAALEERGLVSSTIDPADPARVQLKLTTEGASKMQRLADHWGSAFVSI